MEDITGMTVSVLREKLEQRGLHTTGKKAELVSRLQEAMSMEAPTSPSIPAGFDPTQASELSKIKLDKASFPQPLRAGLARLPDALLTASEPGRGSLLEQGQRVIVAVVSVRQSLGLSKMKRLPNKPPQELITRCLANVVTDLSNKVSLDESLATSLETAMRSFSHADEEDEGGAGSGSSERELLAAQLAEHEARANAIRARLGAALQDSDEQRRDALRNGLTQTVVDILTSPTPSGAPRTPAQERIVGQAIVRAVGGSISALPDPDAVLLSWRRGVRDAIVNAAVAAAVPEEDLMTLKSFLWASAMVTAGDPRARTHDAQACSWDAFCALRGAISAPSSTAPLQTRIDWALQVFSSAQFIPASSRSVAHQRPPAPVIPLDDDDSRPPTPLRGRHDERSRRDKTDSSKDWKALGLFVDSQASNPRLACGVDMLRGPKGSAGVTAAHRQLARHWSRDATAISLRDIFGPDRDYATLRLSPTTMGAMDDLMAALASATDGYDVLEGVNESFGVNAIRELVAEGLGLGLSIEAVSEALISNLARDGDVPKSASGLSTLWAEKVEPLAQTLYEEAVRGRPRFASVPAPDATAVPPCLAVTRFVGAALVAMVSTATRKLGTGLTQWVSTMLISDLVFAGRLHLRWHSALRHELTSMAVVAGTTTSLAAAPAYFNYALCATFKPAAWLFGQQAPTTSDAPAAPPQALAVAARSSLASAISPLASAREHRSASGRPSQAPPTGEFGSLSEAEVTRAATLPTSPWVYRNLDAHRPGDACPHCGPGHPHFLRTCKQYTAYLLTADAIKIPRTDIFPVGVSLRSVLTSTQSASGSIN